IAHGLAPGNTHGGDQGAGKCLVFMGQQQCAAAAIKVTAIAADVIQRGHGAVYAVPLVNELFPVLVEGYRKRLGKNRSGCVPPVAERYSDGELIIAGEIDLSHHGDVAVLGAIKLPVHLEIVVKVLPSVAKAYETAGGSGEAGIASYGKMCAVLPGCQYLPPG